MAKSKEELLSVTLARNCRKMSRLYFEYKRMFDIAYCLIDDEERRFLFARVCSEGFKFSTGMSMDDMFSYIKDIEECDNID